ncbi:Transcriptional regulator, IclR family protein [Minicystis rosea]|nr:Transcriptional regulator, IclR family protein [Minicystis rosea]
MPIPSQSLVATLPRRIRGKAVDKRGRIVLRKNQVLLYAKPRDEARGGARVVAIAVTDALGGFMGEIPAGPFSSAWAVVGAAPDESIPIALTAAGELPDFVYLVAESIPADLREEAHDVCACEGAPTPRLPDGDDLVRSDAYTQDIGSGCVNFTTPNRALEEFSFHVCVRTTDPQIGPLHLHELRAQLCGIDAELRAAYASLAAFLAEPGLAKAGAPASTNEAPSALEALQARIAALKARRHAVEAELTTSRAPLSAANAIAWEEEQPLHQVTTLAHGHLLHFKQVWRADGYSMGDLVYSLPLAPGQKKRIAIVDWGRRETAQRTESLDVNESLSAALEHDRDVSEILDTVVDESIHGRSTSKTKGTSFGFGLAGGAAGQGSYGTFQFGGTAGHAAGLSTGSASASSEAWQEASRALAADALQSLRDRTLQSASSVRTQRATVVEAVEQSEQVRVQTEHVANYNHCHALTIQYFEILRHFALHHELADVQECLFVPLLMRPFDAAAALRFRAPLARALGGADRAAGAKSTRAFDALDRHHREHELGDATAYAAFPAARYADEALIDLQGSFVLRLHVERPEETFGPQVAMGDPTLAGTIALTSPIDVTAWQETLGWLTGWPSIRTRVLSQPTDQRDATFQREIVAARASEVILERIRVSAVSASGARTPLQVDLAIVSSDDAARTNATVSGGRRHRVSLRARAGAPLPVRAQIAFLEIAIDARPPAGSRVAVEALQIDYGTAHATAPLLRGGGTLDLTSQGAALSATPLTAAELVDVRREDAERARELLAEINRNLEAAHAAVWRSLAPERRVMMLEGFEVEVPGRADPGNPGQTLPATRRSLTSVVENRLLGIVGNCLVMPVARGLNLDPVFRWDDDTIEVDGRRISRLMNHYMPPEGFRAAPFRVSVPTRGVFAEAVRGACNACEKKDDTRYWRWEESPIPDSPTEILPIDTSSRRAEPSNLTAKDLPAPVVQMQATPAAPAPTGLGAALNLLGQASLFKDLTGLEGTQGLALQSLLANTDAAKHYADKAVEIAQTAAAMLNGDKILDNIDRAFPSEGDASLRQDLKQDLIRTQIGGGSVKSTEQGGEGLLAGGSTIPELIQRVGGAMTSFEADSGGEKVRFTAQPSATGSAAAEDDDIGDMEFRDTAVIVVQVGANAATAISRVVAGTVFDGGGNPRSPAAWASYVKEMKAVYVDGSVYGRVPSSNSATTTLQKAASAAVIATRTALNALAATDPGRVLLVRSAGDSGPYYQDFVWNIVSTGATPSATPSTASPIALPWPMLTLVTQRRRAAPSAYHAYQPGLVVNVNGLPVTQPLIPQPVGNNISFVPAGTSAINGVVTTVESTTVMAFQDANTVAPLPAQLVTVNERAGEVLPNAVPGTMNLAFLMAPPNTLIANGNVVVSSTGPSNNTSLYADTLGRIDPLANLTGATLVPATPAPAAPVPRAIAAAQGLHLRIATLFLQVNTATSGILGRFVMIVDVVLPAGALRADWMNTVDVALTSGTTPNVIATVNGAPMTGLTIPAPTFVQIS